MLRRLLGQGPIAGKGQDEGTYSTAICIIIKPANKLTNLGGSRRDSTYVTAFDGPRAQSGNDRVGIGGYGR